MDIIRDKIYLTAQELINSQIVPSSSALTTYLAFQRKGKLNSWEHKRFSYVQGDYVEHPLTSRKGNVYVEYDSLRDNYKELIKTKLCNNTDPYLYLKNTKTSQRSQQLESFKQSLSGYLEVDPADVTFFFDLKQYSPSDCQRLARAAAWLRLLNNIDSKDAHKKGYKSIQDLRMNAMEVINTELKARLVRFRGKKMNSLQVLYRYMTAFKVEGCECLVTNMAGNDNARKITGIISAWLVNEMSKKTKPSYEDVAEKYNLMAEKKSWQKITTSAIKQHLNKPEIMRIWFYNRHGKYAGDNELQSLIIRRKVPFADAVWDLDGTSLQLYYQNEKGNKVLSDLYVYYVFDEYSTAVLGYSVAFTETSEMVSEALKKAIVGHGYKPSQLRYDNSSANKSWAVSSLMKNMSRVNFPCRAYRGRSKIIETLQGHLEQRVLRKFSNFKGGSPTARNLNSKANPDFLKETKNNLPTQKQAIQQVVDAINDWNNRGEERNKYGIMQGETKLQRYAHAHEKRVKLNYFEIMSLFMIELHNKQDAQGKYTYKTQGISIQVFNKTYNYIVPDADGVGDFIFQQSNLGKKFTVRMNPDNPAFAILYNNGKIIAEAFESEKYAACVADMNEGDASKIRTYQLKQEIYGQSFAKTELEKQKQLLQEIGIKATGTDGYGWHDLPKYDYNFQESQQIDRINGVAEESELVKRLKTIGS